jgi:ATP-binding cassette subfamily B multidrug efflux pump
VTFTYPGADDPVLRNISVRTGPGQTTAIIGSTGSGKSTLVSLVPRLMDATEGRVLVDGVDVRQIDPDLLHGLIGLVPQTAYLFTGTVASNLRYGKADATDEELWQALRTAQGGTNFSGGQRQRLAIARAIVHRPEIYLFDDSFSALDLATDARLRAALRPVTRESAVVIVAQRVSTIVDADQILVMDDGAVVGLGTHDELLAGCPTYAEIVESQLPADAAA